jgi:glycosyltransferase involved in cell wall biosynthesis
MATVSVLILTYNHARYIAQAIDSVLGQKTSHKLKVIILEDCSTDGTQAIVGKYAQWFPDTITAYLHPCNIGRKKGIQRVVYEGFLKLDGDYIAVLEGDDYWSSPDKLEKQVGFLEANPDFVACAHNTVRVYEDGKEPHRFIYWEGIKEVHEVHDFIAMTSFFHISSLVFRNMRRLKGGSSFQYIQNRWCCEIYFNMAHVRYGKLRYFNEDMSVYRVHSGGSFSNMPELKGRIFNIEGHRRFNYWLRYRYLKEFSFAIYRLSREMLRLSDKGELPQLPRLQRYKYQWLRGFYGWLYDWLDAHPKWEPAVFWYGEAPKAPEPRLVKVRAFDGATQQT